MKLLLDTCVWGGGIRDLQQAGHDVVWVGEWETDPGDEEILNQAHDERRVLVTLDKDFGELAVLHGISHSGIIRLVNIPARKQAGACISVLAAGAGDLRRGAIVTVELGRVRIRLP